MGAGKIQKDPRVRGPAEGSGDEVPRSERRSARGVYGRGWRLQAWGAGRTHISLGPRARVPGPRGQTSWHVGVSPSRGAWAMGISGCSAISGQEERVGKGLRRAKLGTHCAPEQPPATVRPGATARARA